MKKIQQDGITNSRVTTTGPKALVECTKAYSGRVSGRLPAGSFAIVVCSSRRAASDWLFVDRGGLGCAGLRWWYGVPVPSSDLQNRCADSRWTHCADSGGGTVLSVPLCWPAESTLTAVSCCADLGCTTGALAPAVLGPSKPSCRLCRHRHQNDSR